ncbi:MAG TPA: zinc ABC transporter substrate-binding protein [Gemmataceae bacterium]|nr:zinc ABC transporter substrate-binding protein [Gemmataceae bacterium]
MSRFPSRMHVPVFLTGLAAVVGCIGCGGRDAPYTVGEGPGSCPGSVIHVIAVENQYGSLVAQLGGQGVLYKSIITNPDADPHEFQTNYQVVHDFQSAQLVVENGLGYDDWSDKILETVSHKPKVLNVGELLGLKTGDNPHVWYDPDAVDRICKGITAALKELNPAGSDYFDARAKELADRLGPYHRAIAGIREKHKGTKVGATESIFVPMAKAAGLDLISPPGLMKAVSEDAQPSPEDVDQFQHQIKEKQIKLLVYNNQTSGNLTMQLQDLAKANGIPIVGVSETMTPVDTNFEDWQITQLKALEDALASSTGK